MSAETGNDIRDDVVAVFIEIFGYDPAGVWSAPGRVNLIGEHTDYNEGFVLPFAINRRTIVALGTPDSRVAPASDPAPDSPSIPALGRARIRVGSEFANEVIEIAIDDLAPETVDGWSAYPLGVAWALGQMAPLSGTSSDGNSTSTSTSTRNPSTAEFTSTDLYLESTVPVGAGLSSSAAIESSVALALNDTWGLGLDRRTLARVGQLAENEAVGAPTGIMDQCASLLGRRDSAVFLDCRSLDAEVIPLGFAEAGLEILIIDTGVEHAHATGGYAERRASCEAGARALGVAALRDVSIEDLPRAREVLDDVTFRRVRHVVTENQRVLDTVKTLRDSGPAAIGELLDASHVSMRDDFEISVPELDLAVETAQSSGAIGARMTGGGFGGSAIALARREDISRIQVAIDGAFAEHGFAQPTMFVVTPSDGAIRER